MAKLIGVIIGLILALGLLFLGAAILAIPTYFLWNWLMPELFAFKVITFWQAIGVNFLASILFKPSVTVNKN